MSSEDHPKYQLLLEHPLPADRVAIVRRVNGVMRIGIGDQVTDAPDPEPPDPPDPPEPPHGELEIVDRRTGITFELDRPVVHGVYVDGSPWAIGPFKVVRTTPATDEVSGVWLNGSELNPRATSSLEPVTGLDSQMLRNSRTGALPIRYDHNRNVGARLPVEMKERDILLSVSSINPGDGRDRATLEKAAVLTCVFDAPEEGSFRPGYVMPERTFKEHNVASIDWSLLRDLPVDASYSFEALDNAGNLHLELFSNWLTQAGHCRKHQKSYGADIASQLGETALVLHSNALSLGEKKSLAISLIQIGIDFWHVVKNGGHAVFRANGGHGNRGLWPIIFAGLMLGDEDMERVAFDADGEGNPLQFSELQQVEFVGGNARWRHNPSSAWEMTDNFRDVPGSYSTCCTSCVWYGTVLSALAMGAMGKFPSGAIFSWMRKYVTAQEELGQLGHTLERLNGSASFAYAFWKAHADALYGD